MRSGPPSTMTCRFGALEHRVPCAGLEHGAETFVAWRPITDDMLWKRWNKSGYQRACSI